MNLNFYYNIKKHQIILNKTGIALILKQTTT